MTVTIEAVARLAKSIQTKALEFEELQAETEKIAQYLRENPLNPNPENPKGVLKALSALKEDLTKQRHFIVPCLRAGISVRDAQLALIETTLDQSNPTSTEIVAKLEAVDFKNYDDHLELQDVSDLPQLDPRIHALFDKTQGVQHCLDQIELAKSLLSIPKEKERCAIL